MLVGQYQSPFVLLQVMLPVSLYWLVSDVNGESSTPSSWCDLG